MILNDEELKQYLNLDCPKNVCPKCRKDLMALAKMYATLRDHRLVVDRSAIRAMANDLKVSAVHLEESFLRLRYKITGKRKHRRKP